MNYIIYLAKCYTNVLIITMFIVIKKNYIPLSPNYEKVKNRKSQNKPQTGGKKKKERKQKKSRKSVDRHCQAKATAFGFTPSVYQFSSYFFGHFNDPTFHNLFFTFLCFLLSHSAFRYVLDTNTVLLPILSYVLCHLTLDDVHYGASFYLRSILMELFRFCPIPPFPLLSLCLTLASKSTSSNP